MIALLYHDVVENGRYSASGFGGELASRYKLDRKAFGEQLDAIARVVKDKPLRALDPASLPGQPGTVILTFDDGGASAHQIIADMLEERGWRGSFFITTDFIGKPAFLTAAQIEDLAKRGHAIGSHSCTHPPLIARRPHAELIREWRDSSAALTAITGAPIRIASVPGGFYARNVAAAAAECGIACLFTSEAVASPWSVDGCRVFGRYTIQRRISPEWVGRIAAGEALPRFLQYCEWSARKMLQRVGGLYYHRLRESVLNGSYHP
jgi:hypothetical protein